MKNSNASKLSFWKIVAAVIMICGLYSSYIRFTKGLGASTHLSDSIPWGLWIGFDFLGVGLAAAGFTIAVMVHVFNIHKFEPIVRPAILTAYIGYTLVVLLLIIDLGRPQNFWHPLVMWNLHSVMFEITWCVICYSAILTLEFAPVVLEKYNLTAPIKILRKISIPVVILGVIFSTLHQSSFGSLYLIVPGRLYPLWYSTLLPVNFYISCIAAGLSMIIFESYLNARAFNLGLRLDILSGLAKIVLYVLIIGFLVRITDMIITGKTPFLFLPRTETYMFYAEVIVGTFIPVYLLSQAKYRKSRMWLYVISIFTLSGFVLNRINVAVTGLVASSKTSYFPSFDEISITMMLVVLGMWAFKLVSTKFPVFVELENLKEEKLPEDSREMILSE
ncbi:MAG: Ni/Fe-hydrogenase cytochrome b subunit [Bacteroidota bacterium]|nr:Ni/Fe-hydrogenase cytochrome b subunit [Bacteroidota bacterium]MDP4190158.1 Ni/Fe-hydrogenase cytochrome b subunit [Bacteroidota bacterium]MDP4193757.1 Ni/Fe-hydrogenase cytochrome b subunit [Bacteroidota bacterium]